MTILLDDIYNLLGKISTQVAELPGRISIQPNQVFIVNGLSEISQSLGLVTAGEFRVGNNFNPGSGFTGVRIAYPPMTYDSQTWNIAGVNNDVLEFGLSAADGKAYAGAGSVVLDASGITLNVDPGGTVYLKWNDGTRDIFTVTPFNTPVGGGGVKSVILGIPLTTNWSAAMSLQSYGHTTATVELYANAGSGTNIAALTVQADTGAAETITLTAQTVAFSGVSTLSAPSAALTLSSLNLGTGSGAAAGEGRGSVGWAARVDGSGGGLYAGATSDVQFYRSAANMWRTPDGLTVDLGFNLGSASSAATGEGRASVGWAARVDGSTGGLYAGSGSDVQFYRTAADMWRTPDGLTVDLGFNLGSASGAATGEGRASVGWAARIDGSSGGLYAGSGSDVQWYRNAADVWRTPDNVVSDGYVKATTAWGSGILAWVNHTVFGSNITGSPDYPFSASIPASITLKSWAQSWTVATTNNGSNYWTVEIVYGASLVSIASFNTSAAAASTWTSTVTALSQALSTSNVMLFIKVTKTGAPGTLNLAAPQVWFYLT